MQVSLMCMHVWDVALVEKFYEQVSTAAHLCSGYCNKASPVNAYISPL